MLYLVTHEVPHWHLQNHPRLGAPGDVLLHLLLLLAPALGDAGLHHWVLLPLTNHLAGDSCQLGTGSYWKSVMSARQLIHCPLLLAVQQKLSRFSRSAWVIGNRQRRFVIDGGMLELSISLELLTLLMKLIIWRLSFWHMRFTAAITRHKIQAWSDRSVCSSLTPSHGRQRRHSHNTEIQTLAYIS